MLAVADALDRAAREIGVNFIGGFSALVHKGFTPGDHALIAAIPRALAATEMGVRLGQHRLDQGRHQHGCGGADGAGDQGRPPDSPPPPTAWARPSWWCSATRSRTTRSWPAPSTAWASRTA